MVTVLVLLACGGRALDAPDPLALALADLDALLAERVQPESLDRAIAQGWALLGDAPEHPRVLGTLARAYAARGYSRPGPQALDDLDQAYRLSRRCLARNPGWRSRLEVAGGRVVPDVTARLLPSDAPCLDSAMMSLGHRLQARGAAGWVDLRELGLLAEAALALDEDKAGWAAPWAQGLVLTVSPQADEADQEAGAAAFREAARREPTLMTASVDRLTYVRARQDDRPTLVRAINSVRLRHSPARQDHAWALENRRGLERLEALLEDAGS